MKEILEKIKTVISERTGFEKNEIKLDSYFMDDLNINEMELAEIIGELEEMFTVELDDIELEDIKTVSDLVHAITDKIE